MLPTLVVHPTGDTEIRVHQAEAIRDAAGGGDVTYETIKGAPHYLHGRRREADGPDRRLAARPRFLTP